MAAQILKMTIQFRRDTTANWTLHKDVVPAAGEPCFDLELHTLKIGDGTTTYENLPAIGGVDISVDGASIILSDGTFKLYGFDTADVGAQPRKKSDGTLEWIVPSSETLDGLQTIVAGLQTDVASLQTDVAAIQEVLTPSAEGETPLVDRVAALEEQLTGTGEGSIDQKISDEVASQINDFAAEVSDDGVVNTFKELVDYVATHAPEAAQMAADITALQELVGDTSVSTQIADAIADIETGDTNVIEAIKLGDTLLDIVEKTVTIPVGAGLKASDEVTVAADGTLGIGQVSVSKLVQADGDELILDGGNAG